MTAIKLGLWPYETGVFYLRPWFRFDAISIGCCMALVRLPSAPRFLLPVAGIGLTMWCWQGEQISRAWYITIQTLLAAVILFSVIKSAGVVRQLFSNGLLRWLGTVSYSLYLWQQLFLVTSAPNWGSMRRFPLNVMLAFLVASASHYLIEQPFLRLKERLGH
jgi:peptidoglycan/LPS O-acetylase OafA/YrhL